MEDFRKNFTKTAAVALLALGGYACQDNAGSQFESHIKPVDYQLAFDYLPQTWDEGLPIGNGKIGALVWEKAGRLRISLDHVDLWDLRPMENLGGEEWSYKWVEEQWEKDNYKKVQDLFDKPYNQSPAPSKIPGAALEFESAPFGKVQSSKVYLDNALAEVVWASGVKLKTFVQADKNVGFFEFEGVGTDFQPELLIPEYVKEGASGKGDPVTGKDLRNLGYEKGNVVKTDSSLIYHQPGWGDFSYKVIVKWRNSGGKLSGVWNISPETGAENSPLAFGDNAFAKQLEEQAKWWDNFWAKSSISLPDSVLEKQWYLEQYKFGSAARADGPPISLQAVWTADNGKLPPWKGDYHHDLNTQLSYWPAYTSNHLDLEIGFTNWLWRYKDTFEQYTADYFGTNGLNVPGVSTLEGDPMGGWIQYSFGPTVSGWLAQHFYLHYKYSMDKDYLKDRAYPWFKEVAIYLDEVSVENASGKRKLPISSSPEYHNNSREAWFGETTNFDLAIIRFVYEKAAELALELGKEAEADKWKKILAEWPELAVDEESGMMVAPGEKYNESHRHFSHLLSIHPLSTVNWSDGPEAREIISNTVQNLKDQGSDYWVGYSFSWLGNLQARMLDGEAAAETLRTFATSFCLPNSFHVNGDQSGNGHSKFKYRPFTLEGNFAFAAGLQEMLLQSHEGFIRLFPAIPADWKTASFDGFLAQGAFKISAEKQGDTQYAAKILAQAGGKLKLLNPLSSDALVNGEKISNGGFYEQEMKKGEEITLVFEGK
ncbi:glycosyl hydrolase family 95 catalytic domain-containing protein [Echinicola shivajiensis]|uniref:glycosyl hydrolase family 95 catalytic domain-containing protein n=1 Tax=Echinicola shivajiensis TaxID=1035916 RepID=UPI001BFC21F2|nr:glycoside hydrolase N-terminal domain-containing protein [Echinicola shivajiensis]